MITAVALRKILAASYVLGTSGGLVKLFKEDLALTPNLTPASFVEADYDGYAAFVRATSGAAFSKGDGTGVIAFAAINIRPSGDITPNTIHGYWIEGAAASTMAGEVICAYKFAQPITVQSAVDSYWLIPLAAIGNPLTDLDIVVE